MLQIIELFPGVTLRCFRDSRFKQAALSFQLVRPMCRQEAAMNALLPAVLLRGTRDHGDLRAITLRLDELYGASVGTLVRRIGDYQTTGLYCGFMEDRFALPGDEILAPMVDFLGELLFRPALENGAFRPDFVEGEKRNLIATIDSERNDKRGWANVQMLRAMCAGDSFGIPRLGEREDVAAITAQGLYDHFQEILRTSRMDLFYVGSAEPEQVAALLKNMLGHIDRSYVNLPAQTPGHFAPESHRVETMEVAQGKLCMGFTTPITLASSNVVAAQLFNLVFGAGMTNKLFQVIREQLSLCYDIGSGYQATKGIVTVSAGIDSGKDALVRAQVLNQLRLCQEGDISEAELAAAKHAMYSSLRSVHDSPGAIENFYTTAALSGQKLMPDAYMEAVAAVTLEDVAEAAKTVKLHTVYFLKGVAQ